MSGISAQAPHAGAEDSPGNTSVFLTRESESHSDCSRLSKADFTNAPSIRLATEVPLNASTNKPQQHSHQHESQSLHQRGSNQFGSDSGLGGCTASISSENSLIVNATGIEQTEVVNSDVAISHCGESGKHHGRGGTSSGRLVNGVLCGTSINAALDDLSNNKISSGERNGTLSSDSQSESCAINKSDTRYSKDFANAPSGAKSNSFGLNPSAVSSSGNSRADDTHKVKQSSRSIDGDVVSPTSTKDNFVPQARPDKIDGARNNSIDHSHNSPPSIDVPKLRSALKKSTKTAADSSNRSPRGSGRNVCFNQTVIVFCEEIETSSPGEYDPPVDYRDSPDCLDSTFGLRKDRVHSKPRLGHGSNSYDLDLLSTMVGQDASKLTDEQLFGLLEGSSFFQERGLNSTNNLDNDIFIQRLRSNQSYLCHDAISDTDSESSLIVHEACSTADQTAKKTDRRSTQIEVTSSKQQRQIHESSDKACVSNSENQRSPEVGSNNDQFEGKKIEPAEESGNRSAVIVSQASMPARVRVTTLETQSKKSQSSSKPNLISKDLNNHQSNEVAQSQQKVIHSFNKLDDPTNSHQLFIKQSDIDSKAFSKPQILTNSNINSNQQDRTQPTRSNLQYDRMCSITTNPDISYRAPGTKICCDKYPAPNNPETHPPLLPTMSSQKEKGMNIQSSQINPACHICMVIESNRTPDTLPPPSSVPNQSTRQTLNNTISRPEIHDSLGDKQISRHINYHGKDVIAPESQQRQRVVPLDTSTQSCASCRELTLSQKNANQSTGSNLSRITQVPGQPQVRPIACQIVYVVDQNGNRIRALQVVRSPQPSHANIAQPARQSTGASVSVRLPNPSSFAGEQSSRQPIYVMQNTSSNVNYASSGSSLQSISRDVHLSNLTKTGSAGQFIIQTNPMTGPHQQMLAPNHSGPRNHTIYYVQQPLAMQNLRNNSGSLDPKGTKSFPDVHEIRRLDGIRAPLVDSHTPRPHIDPRLNQAASSRREHKETLSSKRDDLEDPTFGFSNRPAVKVVSSVVNTDGMTAQSKLGRQNGLTLRNAPTNEQPQGQNFESQTLDRQFRNHLKQEASDGMPNTSSMYEINQNLSSYISHAVSRDGNPLVKSKGDQSHPVRRDLNDYESVDESAHARSGKDLPKPEVAYMMNI